VAGPNDRVALFHTYSMAYENDGAPAGHPAAQISHVVIGNPRHGVESAV